MAIFETVIQSDLQKPLQVKQLSGNFFSSDNEGNKITVEVFDGGVPATLSGGVTGYIIRGDGATVTTNGTLVGNKASIVLPASAYIAVGQISIVVKVSTMTVGACTSFVYRTTTDTLIDPGHVIPSISELLAKIADCEAATLAASSATASANMATASAVTATLAANSSANHANQAASAIDEITVVASTISPSSAATATVSTVSGHKHIAFGIPKGNTGKDFHIAKTFVSIAQMEAYTGTDIEAYDFAMIDTGSAEDEDTGKLFCYEPENTPKWRYIGDLSGKQGIKGETGNGIASVTLNPDYTLSILFTDSTVTTTSSIRGETGAVPSFAIGSVSTGAAGSSASATITGTDENPILNMVIPRGDKGENGDGVPSGGTVGQVLKKASNTDYDVEWDDEKDPTGKADKVSGATAGNFAGLDSNGNLTDSGSKASDFLTSHQDITGKADKVQNATSGNFAGLDTNGNLTDSGHKHSDYLTRHQDITGKANAEAIAIVSDGDTHAAIVAGQYVYIKNHNTLNEGMYTANSAIAANAALTSSNVTAVTSGAINALLSDVETLNSKNLIALNGSKGASGNTVDLNNLTTSQTLYWTAANKGGVSNKPFDAAGVCFTIADGNRLIQYVGNSAGDLAYRNCFSGSWSAWKIFATNDQIDTFTTVTFTPESGITNALFIRRNNRVVVINGYLQGTNAFGSNQLLGTIESGHRPSSTVRFLIEVASAAYEPGDIAYGAIGTDGKLSITAKSGNTFKNCYFSVSYIV